MIILCGKTCSGKDSVGKVLEEKYGFYRIVTTTTRTRRKSEIEDTTYHYETEERFVDGINNGEFLEYRKYDTVYGTWYYGTKVSDIKEAVKYKKSYIIVTPSACDAIKNVLPSDVKCTVVYLYANQSSIKGRLKKRGDNVKEAERRIEADNNDFKGFFNKADRIVYNSNYDDIYVAAEAIADYEV